MNADFRNIDQKQLGASIVEFMVAIAIGMIVILVVISAYLSGSKVQQSQSENNRLADAGRFAIITLTREIQKAGYRDKFSNTAYAPKFDFGPGKPVQHIIVGSDGAAPTVAATGITPATYNSDEIEIWFWGQNNPDSASDNGDPDGSVVDCLGNAISSDTLVHEMLSVRLGTDGEPGLYCAVGYEPAGSKGVGGVVTCAAASTCALRPQTWHLLVPGVEAMQFLYGRDKGAANNREGVVGKYEPASSINNSGNDYGSVYTIRIGIVMRTDSGTSGQNSSQGVITGGQTFNLLGDFYEDNKPAVDTGSSYTIQTPDGRLRKIFSTTVALRNHEF